jgi:hypothetical protein
MMGRAAANPSSKGVNRIGAFRANAATQKPYGALLKARVCFAGSPCVGISIHNRIDDKARHFQRTGGNSRIQAGGG